MSREALRRAILNCVVWRGTSRFLIDSRELQFSEMGLRLAAGVLAETVSDLAFDVIACSGVGGIPLGVALKLLLGDRVTLLCVRHHQKGYDLNKLVEGPRPANNGRVLIVDDLLNHGVCFDRVAGAITAQYPWCSIVGTAVLIDYENLGSKRVRARDMVVRSVFTTRQLNLRVKPVTQGQCIARWQNLEIATNRPVVLSGDVVVAGVDPCGWVGCDRYSGELLWRTKMPETLTGQAVGTSNSVVLMAGDIVRCMSGRAGLILWQTKLIGFDLVSRPQVEGERLLVVGKTGAKSAVFCLDVTSGQQLWSFETLEPEMRVNVSKNGILLSGPFHLYCLDLDGSLRWSRPAGDSTDCAPVAASDLIFTTSAQGTVEARDWNGDTVWARQSEANLTPFPIVYGDRLIVPLTANAIIAFDQQTADVLWYNRQETPVAVTAAQDGVFALTTTGMLSQVHPETGCTLWSQQLATSGQTLSILVVEDHAYVSSERDGLLVVRLIQEGGGARSDRH